MLLLDNIIKQIDILYQKPEIVAKVYSQFCEDAKTTKDKLTPEQHFEAGILLSVAVIADLNKLTRQQLRAKERDSLKKSEIIVNNAATIKQKVAITEAAYSQALKEIEVIKLENTKAEQETQKLLKKIAKAIINNDSVIIDDFVGQFKDLVENRDIEIQQGFEIGTKLSQAIIDDSQITDVEFEEKPIDNREPNEYSE